MFLLLFITSFFSVDGLRFSTVDDVFPINVSSDSRILTISKEDLLVVLDLNTNYVILGGRNAAYNISLWDVNIRHTISWPTNNATRNECSMIISSVCDNFIRSYYQLRDGFVICGTHGQRPMCKRFTGGWDDPYPVETFAGEGLSPFTPMVKAPFVNADGRIFTANAPEYSQSADAIWLRKTVGKREKAIRTARGESAFDSAQFVAMEANGQDVLAFFNELPTDAEGCGLRNVARVGRVCKDDPGAISFPDEWSSFVKARLECSVTQDGYDSLLFNQLTSLVGSDGIFVGVFRSQLAGLGFSAICLFSRETVSTILASPFSASKSDSCPRATSDALQRTLRGNPLIQKKIKSEPVFVYSGEEDVVAMAVQHNVTDLSGLDYTVFYLGTTRGRIFKVAIGGGGTASHVATLIPLSIATTVKGLWLRQEPLANQKTSTSMFVLSESSVTKSPTTTCSQATNCSVCLSMGDPQCAWILHGAECVTVEENHFRREYLTQQMAKCPKGPPPVAEVKKSLANLPCLCQKAEPCVTQVIQKELQPIISSEGAVGSLFFLSIGLLAGALLNCLCTRTSIKSNKEDDITRPTRLDAYAKSPVLRQSPRASMHSSIHTYC